jgi:hypothetical protein
MPGEDRSSRFGRLLDLVRKLIALWRELSLVIIRHGGSLARLFKDICDRVFPIPAPGGSIAMSGALPAVFPPSPAAAGTGPP